MMKANVRGAGTLRLSEPGSKRPGEGDGCADRRSTESSPATATNMDAMRRERES
jgi:hypothetical protein